MLKNLILSLYGLMPLLTQKLVPLDSVATNLHVSNNHITLATDPMQYLYSHKHFSSSPEHLKMFGGSLEALGNPHSNSTQVLH